MWMTLIFGVFLFLLLMYLRPQRDQGDLFHIPGPNINIWWDLFRKKKPDQLQTHKKVSALAVKYGAIFKMPQFGGPIVIASGFDAIYKVLVTSGREFGGRDNPYRIYAVYKGTGIVHSENTDILWKTLRMTVQRHLKQFGEGMPRLEDVIIRVSDESMFSKFASKVSIAFDPKEIIEETALRTVIFLICGDVSENDFDKIIALMKEYMGLVRQCHPVIVPISYRLLDAYPWLRFLGIGPGKIIDQVNDVKNALWKLFDKTQRENLEEESILKVFREHQEKSESDEKCVLCEDDLKSTCVNLLVAGTMTTTDTFHGLMNILAHNKNVQDTILAEIKTVTGGNTQIRLEHRSRMHYARATLLETLRYTSVVGLGVPRSCRATTKLNDYTIPKGTRMSVNLWHLHHDPEFWGDPHVFRPERFLDNNGELVAADHTYRKHLMPFGAGVRVCVAETLAMSRLFLWITSLIQRFEIVPAPGNMKSSATSDNLVYDGLICSNPYEIILKERT